MSAVDPVRALKVADLAKQAAEKAKLAAFEEAATEARSEANSPIGNTLNGSAFSDSSAATGLQFGSLGPGRKAQFAVPFQMPEIALVSPASLQQDESETDGPANVAPANYASEPAPETSELESDEPTFEELNSPEQQALKELLENARADLTSEDPETIKQAEIVIAYAEAELWQAETARLDEHAQEQAEETEAALGDDSTGEAGAAPDSEQSGVVPDDKVMIEGVLVDPEVAEALIAQQVADARAAEAQAQADAAFARLAAYVADPNYAAAESAAEVVINAQPEVLRAAGIPEGMVVDFSPTDTAAEAEERLDIAEAAGDAAAEALDKAEAAAAALEVAADAPEGGRDDLYAEAGEHSAAADRLLTDAQVPLLELTIEDLEAYVDTLGEDTEERTEAETTLENLEALLENLTFAQQVAPANEQLAEAWGDLVTAEGREEQFFDIGENIIENLRDDPDYDQYFRAEGFNELDHNGRASLPTGEREGYEYVERDGQLYLSIDYANRDEPLEIQLTYASGEAPDLRSEALLEFDQQWEELTGGLSGSLDSHSRAGLNGAIDASNTALEEFYLAQADQQTSIADQLAGPAAEAAEALDDAREQYGDGTLVAGGETPVQIQINPDLNLDGLELDLSGFDLADLDGRWVHPDVANAWSALSDALARIQQGEDLQERTVALFLEEHSPDYFGLQQDDWEVTAKNVIEEGGVIEQGGNLYLDPSVLDGSGILDGHSEVELTFEPDDPWQARSDAAQRLDQEWADFQGANEGDGLESARETLTEASDDFTASLDQFGSGTTEELVGSLPEGVEPVLVPIDGEQRFVHPEVAEALFTSLDLQVQFDEVNLAREQALEAADLAAFQSTQPSVLPGGGSAAEGQQELQEAWDHEDTDNGVNDALDRLADSMDDRNTAHTSALGAEGAGLEAEHPELAPLHDLIAAGDGDDLLTGDNLAPEIERLLETETGQAWQAAFQELDRLGGEREEITNIRAEAEADRDWKDFLLQVPLEERRNPDNWLELESLFVEQNLDAAARTLADRQSQLPEQVTIDDKLEEAIGIALGTDDRSVIDPVADQIRTIGDEGDNVEVSLLTYSDNGVRPTATFQVESSTGTSWLVFEDGAKYRDLEDLQKNGLLSENGQLYVPRVLSEPGAGEEAGYEWVQAADGRTTTEQIAEPLVGLVTGIATGLAILVPVTAPVTATVAFAGGAYLGWGSLDRLDNMRDHGRSLLSTEGLMEGAMVVTTVLPMASSAFRFLGLARAGMATEASLAASIGAVNESLAAHAALLSANGDPLFSVARWLDGGAIFSGAPLLSYSWFYVMANAGYMPVLDLANGLVSLGIGAFGTGMGYRGFRDTRPGQTMQLTDPSGQPITAQLLGGARPTGPDDVFIPFHTPDTGQRFQFVRDDTGAYVIPWMRKPWRQSPQSNNAAPRPAQHDNGVPIFTRENPANHVRPEQDEPSPAPSPHYSQLPERGTGDLFTLVGNDLGRSSPYATLPPRYTGDLSYTSGSGSEPRWPSYLFEQRTSETLFRDYDPAKARADEYQRYLRELPYHSAEEMALRYGPGGPTPPATAIRTILPDFRLGGAARVRLYGGDFGAGSPTMLSAGVGIGTKTNYPDLFWALLYSMAGRSPTVALNTFGQEAVVSLRPREYRNLTAKEAGLSPTSTQTALPVRASELLPIGESNLFTNSSGYHPVLRKAAVVGRTPDGAASVVEVTYSMLIGGEVPLTPPQRDFFSVPAERAGGFVRLLGEVPFDRVMAEFKATLRPPALASLVEAVATWPRFGLETRREAAVKDFLRPGDIISQPSFDQIQSTFGTGRLKVQFVVGDHRRASEFVAEVNNRNSDSIDVLREMVSNGLVDRATAVSFVRNPIQSGSCPIRWCSSAVTKPLASAPLVAL
jgi:hypothetical protein